MTHDPLVIRSMIGTQGLTFTEQYGRTKETHEFLRCKNGSGGPPQGVIFRCRRTQDELYKDMQDKVYVPNYVQVSDSYFREAELLLLEMRVGFCEVDFMREQSAFEKIRGHAARLVRGSSRIPLVVSTPHEKFVIKPYDTYDAVREKKVLERVSGKCSPKVLHLGTRFYAEEMLDAAVLPSLASRVTMGTIIH